MRISDWSSDVCSSDLAGQRQQGLDRALAEAALAHDDGAVMVLERAGDDLGGRGAAGVDQHDDRKAVRGVARPGIIAFDVALLAAALGDDLAMLQEGVGQAEDRKSTRLNSSH